MEFSEIVFYAPTRVEKKIVSVGTITTHWH